MIFRKREVDERTKSGYRHDWSKLPDEVDAITLIDPKADTVRFRRVKKSHQGLREYKNIKRLFAYNVDDDFLREISCLSELTYLWVKIVTAEDFAPLTQLKSLEFLILQHVQKAKSFSFACDMPALRHLCIEWAKHITTLEDFRAKQDLLSFGIEGATEVSSVQKIASLTPILQWKQLESLYLTNTKVLDGNLRCLAQISSLRCLETARFYPKSEFDALKAANPNLKCDWFDKYEIEFPKSGFRQWFT